MEENEDRVKEGRRDCVLAEEAGRKRRGRKEAARFEEEERGAAQNRVGVHVDFSFQPQRDGLWLFPVFAFGPETAKRTACTPSQREMKRVSSERLGSAVKRAGEY